MEKKKDLLSICCVCHKIKIGNCWVGNNYSDYQKQIDSHNLTHGYCPICLGKEMQEVEEFKENKYI